jgi:hypothetical protein
MSRLGSTRLPTLALLCLVANGGCFDDASGPAADAGGTDDASVASADASSMNESADASALDGGIVDAGTAPGEADAADSSGPADARTADDAGLDTGSSTTDGGDDGGRDFLCDSGDGSPITCDGRTQACKLVVGGAYPGIHPPACVTLPESCLSAPTCTCVEAALSPSSTCDVTGGNFTATEDVP